MRTSHVSSPGLGTQPGTQLGERRGGSQATQPPGPNPAARCLCAASAQGAWESWQPQRP